MSLPTDIVDVTVTVMVTVIVTVIVTAKDYDKSNPFMSSGKVSMSGPKSVLI